MGSESGLLELSPETIVRMLVAEYGDKRRLQGIAAVRRFFDIPLAEAISRYDAAR